MPNTKAARVSAAASLSTFQETLLAIEASYSITNRVHISRSILNNIGKFIIDDYCTHGIVGTLGYAICLLGDSY
jgi:hypothetical protein